MLSISIITPTVRPELIEIVHKCLRRQTFRNFEWIIVSPKSVKPTIQDMDVLGAWIDEPIKRAGDHYGLNKAWNEGLRHATGELFVSIVDGLWFPPDTLEKLWYHYQNDNKSCVGGIGHQYDRIENGKPEHKVWSDPRVRLDQGSFYEIKPMDFELCLASIPMRAVKDVGGFDEEYDKYAALSEKELCYRIDLLGYKFYLDQTMEYRAIQHPRLTPDWDTKYEEGVDIFHKHIFEIQQGKRRKLDFLKS